MEEEIKELLNKCDNCKLKECIACEFTWTDIQKIKKYIENIETTNETLDKECSRLEQKESILDKVTDKLKEVNKKYKNEYENIENMELLATKICVLQELSCVIGDIEEILNIIEGEKK